MKCNLRYTCVSIVASFLLLNAAASANPSTFPSPSPSPALLSSPSPLPAPGAFPTSPTPEATSVDTSDHTLVPRGTIIIVETHRGYKSYGESTGSKVTYDVVQDVIVDSHVVAKAGDVGEGQVLNAQSGSTNFWSGEVKGANLRISLDKIYNFCGDVIEIDFARTEFRMRQGLFGSKKDVEVSKGQQYQALTERPIRVCSEKTSATPAPIPSAALEGDKN